MSVSLLDKRYAVDSCKHKWHMGSKFDSFVGEDHDKLATLYWLTTYNKIQWKRFIANSSSCTNTESPIHMSYF